MELPKRIGDLVVEGLLGEGGMGRVYLCTDEALGRHIAVKVLQPQLLADATMRERFVREARALAKVKSPHVVTVHAIGEDPVVGPYVVMERLIGEDLLVRLHTRGALSVDDVLLLARAAAQGLAHAHDAGVVHRDIKPANLFCKREGEHDHLVITDFGLAKDVGAPPGTATGFVPASQLTQADVIVGTPAYLAPELARGLAASPSSDLYALGATVFHLLAGEPPFIGESTIEVITKAVLEVAPRVSSRVVGVPVELDALINDLLQKRPDDRPASAAIVLARLSLMMPGYSTMTPSRPFTNPAIALGLTSSQLSSPSLMPSSSAVSPNGSTQVMGSLSPVTPSGAFSASASMSASAASLTAAMGTSPTPSPTDDTLPSIGRAQVANALAPGASEVSFFSFENVRTLLSPDELRGFSRRPMLWAAATVAFALTLSLVLALVVGGDRRDRIEDGDAAIVQAEIEAIDNKKATDLVDLGLAHWTQDRRKQAFATWRQAVHAGAVDEVMIVNAFAACEQKNDDGAEELLAEWKAPIEPGLRDALEGSWWPRHHALAVLEARKTATDADRLAVALKDIGEGDCASRRYGLSLLKRYGKGSEAMQAIKLLQQNLPNNICLITELRPTEDAVRRRTNKE